MLLRLRLANHRSVRDEVELSLVSSRLHTVAPPGGDWAPVTNRVAGIYGSNASGKSTILHGFKFLVDAVRNSATRWSDRPTFPHTPFAFDPQFRGRASLYEIDLTVDGIRHTYGFRSSASAVVEEWLYNYPEGRKRVLFERSPTEKLEFGRSLGGDNVRMGRALGATQLFLSFGAANRHPVLERVRHQIIDHIRFARFDESDQRARLDYVVRVLADESMLRQAEALLSMADLGVSGVRLLDVDVPPGVREFLLKLVEATGQTGDSRLQIDDAEVEGVLASVAKRLRFVHGPDPADADAALDLSEESRGTVAWLALAVPAVESLRTGDVFVVDEIDSSLHPRLTASLIAIFKDPEVNPRASQLVFTSHDTSLLGRLHGDLLLAEEVWLTEKGQAGITDLYSLAEFPVRERDNLERRYMQGRYGGVPSVSQERLHAALRAKRAS